MPRKRMSAEDESRLVELIDKYGPDYLIKRIGKGISRRKGRPAYPENWQSLQYQLFYMRVLEAKKRLGNLGAALEEVGQKAIPKKSLDTARSYFNKGRLEFFEFLRSGDRNMQAVWPNSRRDRPKNLI